MSFSEVCIDHLGKPVFEIEPGRISESASGLIDVQSTTFGVVGLAWLQDDLDVTDKAGENLSDLDEPA